MTENTRKPNRARAAAMGLSALLLGVAACTAELPSSAALDEMDVTEAQVQAEQAGVLVPLRDDKRPLYIIDGVDATEVEARELPADAIARIEVVKGEAARRAYGERGVNGVVRVATNAHVAVPAAGVREALTVRAVESAAVSTPAAGVPVSTPAAGVPASTPVAGVPVSTPAAGVPASTPAPAVTATTPAVGVPVITPAQREILVRQRATARQLERAQARPIGTGANSPLIVVDGVVASASVKLSSVAPESIESIEVVKGAAARALYDDPRAANGVIVITTKAARR